MHKIKNKFIKRMFALALSGAMIVSSLTTYASEETYYTREYYEESDDTQTDSGDSLIENAEENEGSHTEQEAEESDDSEASVKTEAAETKPNKGNNNQEESAKADSSDTDTEIDIKQTEDKSTDAQESEQDEKVEDLKAYVAPPASAISKTWPNYADVFRGSVFGYTSTGPTNKKIYNLDRDDKGNMRIVVDGGNKIALTDDGRAMYFYQVPIDKPFVLKAKATINLIGNNDKNDGQVGFGLMARDDMLIDVGDGENTHAVGEAGYTSDYVAAGMLMGSNAADAAVTASTNGFSRINGALDRSEALAEGKIAAKGEIYDLSITFDGTKYTCQINDYPAKEYEVSLNKIDSAYQYIGMFAARKADISFSKIYLEVDGEDILDQVSTRYSVTLAKEGNGTLEADSTSVIPGKTVTLTAKSNKGYCLDSWQILTGDGLTADFEIDNDNRFTMPEGNVSIKAIFRELPTQWDFENDTALADQVFEGKQGRLAGLKIDAVNGKFDTTANQTDSGANISAGTTITIPLAGKSNVTVVGKDANYTVDGKAAESAEDSFSCGGITLKEAVITATADTVIKSIRVEVSGTGEIELPELPRKIDVWDFGAKEQSGSNYVNHITTAVWTNFANLAKLANGRFKVDPGADTANPIQDATASFGDLTFCYHDNDILYSTAYTQAYNHQPNQSMRSEATHAYGDYTAAGEWYCNGTGGSGRRYVTIENVAAGDRIDAYVGISNGIETNFYFEYLGTEEGRQQKDKAKVESGDANGVNKKFTFVAKYSGSYKIWADNTPPEGSSSAGKPFYNRIVRYPAVVVQGTIDWNDIFGENVSIQFVNNTTNEVTTAVYDNTGYAVILVPGYSYAVKLAGKDGYSFTESGRTITLKNTDGVNGKTHDLVVVNLDSLPKHTVSGKFIGWGKKTLTGVNATALTFQNTDDNYVYNAAITGDTYSIDLRNGTYAAEITADGYSTRTQVTVKNAAVIRALFLTGPEDTSPLPHVANLYVGYPDKEGSYETINAALRDAKRMNPQSEAERITIHIYPGTYREQAFVNVNYITFVNDTPEQEVKITWYYGIGYAYYSADESGYYNEECAYNQLEKHNAARWGCAVRVKATDFKAKNIVFENSFNRYITEEEIADGVELRTAGTGSGISFVRSASTSAADIASIDAVERAAALALDTGSDKAEFYKCKFLGSQDTLYTGDGSSRAYYKDCFISGNTDYIFGDGNQVFENCELNWQGYTKNSKGEKGGHITAAKDTSTMGYLFYNCKITKPKENGFTAGVGSLGRMWGAKAKVTYVNTEQETSTLISSSGWVAMSGNNPANANLAEYNTTSKDGNAIKYEGVRSTKRVTTNPIDTPEKLEAYFGDDWTPTFYSRGGEEPGTDPSEPESSEVTPSGSEPESSESGEAGGDLYIRGLEESYPYTGAKILPDIEVLDGTILLSPNIDYKVTYKNNVKPGTNTAEVIVSGKGNYAGKAISQKFSIVEAADVKENLADLKGAKIKEKIDPKPYSGSAILPDFTITLKDNTTVAYTQNTDPSVKGLYKRTDGSAMNVNVAVSNNINKGTATILVTGKKDDKGKTTSVKKTFKITAVDISTAEVAVGEAVYAVSGAKPKVTVKYQGTPLTFGKDYTLKYAKNKTAAAKGTVTVVGKGNYAKKCKPKEYTINKLDMSTLTVNAVMASVKGKRDKIKATINDGNGTPLKAAQYDLSVYTDKNATIPYPTETFATEGETIYVVAKAKDGSRDLTGSTKAAEFTVGIDISKAKVVSATDGKAVTRSYTGSAVCLKADDLKVTLKVNGTQKTLVPNQDYKIATHFNNINKGSATVVIQGVGTYGGTKTVKFKITQKPIKDLKKWEELSKVISNMMSNLSKK